MQLKKLTISAALILAMAGVIFASGQADGYTLISIDDATWYGLHNGIGDYQLSDLAPISVMTRWPIAIAVRADVPDDANG